MILTCPECATSYFVDDSKIPTEGRAVKCANCGARWTATPELAPPELEKAEAQEAVKAEAGSEIPDERLIQDLPGEDLPKVFRARADTDRRVREAATAGVIWAGMAGVMAVLIAIAVIFRVDVVRLWPRTASAYASVGLPVNSLGLVIEGVRFEPALQDGHAALAVSGMIRNIEDRPVVSPALRISLLDADGKAVTTKIARPADAKIPSGETRHFAIALLDPPVSARELEVAFAPHEPVNLKVRQSDPAPAQAVSPVLRPATSAPTPPPIEAQPLAAGTPDALSSHD